MLSGCCNAYGKVMQVFHIVRHSFMYIHTCLSIMYKYTYRFFCLYWFLKSIVFVSVCLGDGLFTWTINSLNFLLYVVSLRCRYFEMTSFSKDDVWSLSSPSLWSKKWAGLMKNTFMPLCSKTIPWIFKSVFFSFGTLVPGPTTCLQKARFSYPDNIEHRQLMGILITLFAWRLWIWYTRGPQTVVKHDHQ